MELKGPQLALMVLLLQLAGGAVIPRRESKQIQDMMNNLLAQPVNLTNLITPLLHLYRTKRNAHDDDVHFDSNGVAMHIKYDDVNHKLRGGVVNITIDDLKSIISLGLREVKLSAKYQTQKGKMIKLDINAELEEFDGVNSRRLFRDITISMVKKGMWNSEVALKPGGGQPGESYRFTMESCSKCFKGKFESDSNPLLNADFKGTYTLGKKFEITLTHSSGIDIALDFALGTKGNVFSLSLLSKAMPQLNFVLEARKNTDGNKSELQFLLEALGQPKQELFSISFQYNNPNDKPAGGKLRLKSGDINTSPLLSKFVRMYGRRRREIRKNALALTYSKVGIENYSFKAIYTEEERNGNHFYKPRVTDPAFYDTDEYYERNLIFAIASQKKGHKWKTFVSTKLSDLKPSTGEVNEVESAKLTMDHCPKCVKGKLVSDLYEDFKLTFEGKHAPGDSFVGSAEIMGNEVVAISLKNGYMEGFMRFVYKGEGVELLLETEGPKGNQELRTFILTDISKVRRKELGKVDVFVTKEDATTTKADIISPKLDLDFSVVAGDKYVKLLVEKNDIRLSWKNAGFMINDVKLIWTSRRDEYFASLKWDFINKESLGYTFSYGGKDKRRSFEYTEQSKISITPTMYAANINYRYESDPRSSHDFTGEGLVELGRGDSDHFKLTGSLDLDGDDKAVTFALENGQLQYSYE